MPISYEFRDKDNQRVLLDTIDKEVCEEFKTQYSAANYSVMFMTITSIGDIANRSGTFNMDDFNEAIRICGYDEQTRWKILRFVNGTYVYHSWR